VILASPPARESNAIHFAIGERGFPVTLIPKHENLDRVGTVGVADPKLIEAVRSDSKAIFDPSGEYWLRSVAGMTRSACSLSAAKPAGSAAILFVLVRFCT